MIRVWLRATALALAVIGVDRRAHGLLQHRRAFPAVSSPARDTWRAADRQRNASLRGRRPNGSACFFDMAQQAPARRCARRSRRRSGSRGACPASLGHGERHDREHGVATRRSAGCSASVSSTCARSDSSYVARFKGFTWNPRFGPDPPTHGLSLAPDRPELWVLDAPNSVVHLFDVSGLPDQPPRRIDDIRLSKPISGDESPCSRSVRSHRVAPAQRRRAVRLRRGFAGDVIDTKHPRDRRQPRSAAQLARGFRARLGRRQAGLSAAPARFDGVHRTQLPPPLPPETRTVGQLVAESLKLYGARFWPSLALGIGPAVVGVADAELEGAARFAIVARRRTAAPRRLVRRCRRTRAPDRSRPLRARRAGRSGFVAFLPLCLSRLWIFPGIYLRGARLARVRRARGPCRPRRASRLRRIRSGAASSWRAPTTFTRSARLRRSRSRSSSPVSSSSSRCAS